MRGILTILLCFFLVQMHAQSASNKLLLRSTTGVSGSSNLVSLSNQNYVIQQSVGQASVIGTFANGSLIFRQGFIQPNVLTKIVDKKTLLSLEAIVYPNPFMESINIVFSEEITDKISVEIYDMLGRLVFAKIYSPSQNVYVMLGSSPVANYILKVNANKKQLVKKILKN